MAKSAKAIKVSRSLANEEEKNKVAELLHEVYDELTKEAERLGPYGGAIQYLAEKVKTPLKYLPKEKRERYSDLFCRDYIYYPRSDCS